MSGLDRYGSDVLATDWRRRGHRRSVDVQAEPGLVVEEVTTDWCGAIVRVDRDLATVELEDRSGKRRTFPLGPGFLLEGGPVILTAPARQAANRPSHPTRTASGSVAVPGVRARTARASRIYVEGRHDAELVEKVWGDDLRIEGVVVEYLEGIAICPTTSATSALDQAGASAYWSITSCRGPRRPGSPPGSAAE
jgi:hypothetical protein